MTRDYTKGHRRRLRGEIILDSGQSLLNYDVLEYILYSTYSEVDIKPIAKKLMNYLDSLNKVLMIN